MTSLLSKSAPAALALALSPVAALAVPAGGYGDLVEQVAPAVVFIEVTNTVQSARALPDDMPENLRKRFEQQMPDARPKVAWAQAFLFLTKARSSPTITL